MFSVSVFSMKTPIKTADFAFHLFLGTDKCTICNPMQL